jgi:putative ABC transport system substrate-binding protein
MRRRDFITLLGGAVAAWPLATRAQQTGRTYRLGVLLPLARNAPINIAFFDELRRRGIIEGQNLTIDYRTYGQHVDLVSQYAAELVKARVDAILTGGDVAIRAAQQATKTIPILGITEDLLGSGFVNSLARPDGNTTGVSNMSPELDGKRQDILIEAVPGLRRIAALADSNTTTDAKLQALREAARAHNIELSTHRVARGEEIAAAIEMLQASGATALNVLASPMLHANFQLIRDRVAVLGLPAIYQWPELAEDGGFAAYGPRLSQLFVGVMPGQLVEILRGVKIADIPVQQPTKFELVINLKAAKRLGIEVPASILARADEVIE